MDACVPFDGTGVCPTCRFPHPEAPKKNAEFNPKIGPYGGWTYYPDGTTQQTGSPAMGSIQHAWSQIQEGQSGYYGVDTWGYTPEDEEDDEEDDEEAKKDYEQFKEMMEMVLSGFKTEHGENK